MRRLFGAVAMVGLVVLLVVVSRRCEPERADRAVSATSTATGRTTLANGATVQRDRGVAARPRGTLRLEGQVIDDRDEPVPGAFVTLAGEDLRENITTGPDGSFAFEDLVGGLFMLGATKGDMLSEDVEIHLEATTDAQTLKLARGTSARVHVVDIDSQAPIRGATVRSWVSTSLLTRWPPDVTTDAQGNATIHGCGLGWNLNMMISAPNYERHEQRALLAVTPATPNEIEVTLHRGAPVSGVVIDTNHHPVTNWIVAINSGEGSQNVEVDDRGRWTFPSLAAGPHQLEWNDRDWHSATRMLLLDGIHPQEGIELVVDAPGPREDLGGIVVDENARPVVGAKIYARMYKPLEQSVTVTDGAGRFRLSLPPGRDFLVSATKDERASETEISVAARAHEMRLVIRPTVIEGDVVDRRGKPVARARIVHNVGPDKVADDRGHFVLSGFTADTVRLVAVAAERRSGPEPKTWVEANPGDRHVRLVADDVGSLIGRLEEAGKPVSAYTIRIGEERGPFAYPEETVRSADGSFAIHGLPPGPVPLEIVGIGFPPKSLAARVVANRETDLGTIVVDSGQRVVGRVHDASGAGIAGATVIVHRRGELRFQSVEDLAADGSVSTTTDAAGNFELTGFAGSSANRIVARHRKIGTSGEHPLPPSTTSIDLTLATGGAIEGALLGGYTSWVDISRVDDRELVEYCMVDRLQHYACEDLEPGTYLVMIPYQPVMPRRVTVRAGTRTKQDLVFAPPIDASFRVSSPCKQLELQTDDDFHDRIRTTECSDAAFKGVAPGNYRVCADTSCSSISIATGPSEQHFQLP